MISIANVQKQHLLYRRHTQAVALLSSVHGNILHVLRVKIFIIISCYYQVYGMLQNNNQAFIRLPRVQAASANTFIFFLPKFQTKLIFAQ